MKPRFTPKPSQRAIRNTLAVMQAMHDNTAPVIEQPSVKRVSKPRAEREAGVTDALKDWRKYRPDVRLWRNNVGFYKDGNREIRYGLCPGSTDFVGLKSITVTPGLVGKTIGVFFAVELKAPGKAAEEHQQQWIDDVRNMGGIAGVATSAADVEEMLARWLAKQCGDERLAQKNNSSTRCTCSPSQPSELVTATSARAD